MISLSQATRFVVAGAAILLLAAVVPEVRCAPLDGAAGKLLAAGQEFSAAALARGEPELELEALRQQQRQLNLLRHRRHASLARKQQQQQQQQLNNEADVASLLAAASSRQPASQLEDELALRRQLPELIAQAHNDKVAERALLKMLINASLRSLSNMAPQSQSQMAAYYANNKRNPADWQEGAPTDGVNYDLSRLPAFSGESGAGYANLENLDLGQSLQLLEQPAASSFQSAAMDKREYIKPCSFNAISCAKNPFRKL